MMGSWLAAGAWDNFATGFGVAAAVLTVGGIVLLRFQRSRHEYGLMQAALEKGTSAVPAGPPAWVGSMRQGAMLLALGVALAGVGAGGWVWAERQMDELMGAMQSMEGVGGEKVSGSKPRDESGRLTAEGRLYSAARNRWERAEVLETGGQMMTGSGIVLVVLGVVRMGFARVEKKYSVEV